MASGQELRKDSTSETSYWKHSAIERSTSRYTQTAQPASPWQQDKEYQREQNTSNWNSCSSNNWCKTASLAYTRYHQWTTWQTSWPSTQQEKFYIGFSTVLVSTNTNKQQATASTQTRVSPVCPRPSVLVEALATLLASEVVVESHGSATAEWKATLGALWPDWLEDGGNADMGVSMEVPPNGWLMLGTIPI